MASFPCSAICIIITLLEFVFLALWIRNEKKNKTYERRIKVLSTIMVSLILLSLIVVGFFFDLNYTIDIRRNCSNEKERRAIEIAENGIDYSSIFGISRFDGRWANFADAKTINHYEDNVREERWTWSAMEMDLEYSANAVTLSDSHTEGGLRYLKDSTHEIFIGRNVNSFAAIKNDTKYDVFSMKVEHRSFQSMGELNFSSGTIVVKMELHSDEVYGPLSGYFCDTTQCIVFSAELIPLFIFIQPSSHGIS